MLGDTWITPLWTTVAGGVIVVLCQQTYRFVTRWQESRKDVESKDHDLLHELADVMQDKPPTVFNRNGSPGLVTRFGTLETTVGEIAATVNTILEKVQ